MRKNSFAHSNLNLFW